MTIINKDWRNRLIEAHPRLFNSSEERPERIGGYPECGDGWSDLLTRLCGRIDAALKPGETIRVAQIEEKFAGLRFYWHGEVSAETEADPERDRTSRSEVVLLLRGIWCGRLAPPLRRDPHDPLPRPRHGAALASGAGMENVHVVRKAVADRFQKVARRYDRAADKFVADPSSFDNTD